MGHDKWLFHERYIAYVLPIFFKFLSFLYFDVLLRPRASKQWLEYQQWYAYHSMRNHVLWHITPVQQKYCLLFLNWRTLYNNTVNCQGYTASLMEKWKIGMEQWRNDMDRIKLKNSEKKPVPVPLWPPQISYELGWDWSTASFCHNSFILDLFCDAIAISHPPQQLW
jgi:hypothetical protein